MRINGFHQISAFYSIVFNQQYDFKPQHVSLYIFLLNQNNRNNWVEWFKCPIDLGMTGSCIGSKKTYYACLDDLQSWGLINYEKGENMWKAPKISLVVLKSTSTNTSTYTSTVPQSEPLPIPDQHLNLPTYINLQPITSNLQPITNTGTITPDENQSKKQKTKKPEIPSESEFMDYYKSDLSKEFPGREFSIKTKYETWLEDGWKDGNGNKITNWKLKMKNTIPHLKPTQGPNGQAPIAHPSFNSKNMNR